MGFLSRLHTVDGDPGEFILTAPLIYELPGGQRITVAESYITDFASTPKPLQWLPGMHPNGRSRRAAVLHDWLFSNHGRVLLDSGALIELPLAECDALFYQALRDEGVNVIIARAMHTGLRAGSWYHWRKRRDGIRMDDFATTAAWSNYIDRLELAGALTC